MIIEDELVIRVTNEIIRLLKAKEGGASGTPVSGAGAPVSLSLEEAKPPLLVVGPLEALSEGCQKALSARYRIEKIHGLDQRGRPKAPLLITSLGLQALVQVASGDEGCTEEGRALLSALLDSRPAVALASGVAARTLPPTAPGTLVAIYRTAEKTLKEAGLCIVPESDILSALSGKPACPGSGYGLGQWPACPRPAGARAGAKARTVRVLTESVVSNLFPNGAGGPLTLKNGDILTPLAKDWLLAHKIAIQ